MEKGVESLVFLLGAGASVDSGMKVYRGNEEKYYSFDEQNDETNPLHVSVLSDNIRMKKMWNHLTPLIEDCKRNVPGPTYKKIQEMVTEQNPAPCLILTQNVDGFVHTITGNNVTIVELHGTLSTVTCINGHGPLNRDSMVDFKCECGAWFRPNIVLFGESINDSVQRLVYTWIRTHHPVKCYVIGTSMRFPYLRKIVNKTKGKGARVIHVNSDPNYIWHSKREKCFMKPGDPFPQYRLVNRKHPEELKERLSVSETVPDVVLK